MVSDPRAVKKRALLIRAMGSLSRRINQVLEENDDLHRKVTEGEHELTRDDLGPLLELEAALPEEIIDFMVWHHGELCRKAKQSQEEHPELWCLPEEDELKPLPPLTQAAYDAAEAEWEELYAKHPNQAVIYRGSERLAVGEDRTKLWFEYLEKGYKAEEMMVFDILPDSPSADIDDVA